MSAWVAGAVVVGSVISSKAAGDAADVQAGAATASGEVSERIADKQIIAAKETLAEQIAADKEIVDRQIEAATVNLDKIIDAQDRAAEKGETAAAAALDKQIAAAKETLDAQLGLQRELFNRQVENLRSFKEAGEAGQSRMMDLLGLSGNKDAPGYGSAATTFKVEGFDPNTLFQEFSAKEMEQDPGYAFRLAEGPKAIERSTAARGGLQSGAALKAAARYGQEMGSQEYQNAFNRFQATKGFQAQEYGNAFNRFATERQNQLAPLMALTASGQASAAGQAAAAGNFASGASQAMQNAGAGQAAAYGNYGTAMGNIAAQQGAGQSAAYGNFGAAQQNAFGASNAARQSAYGNYGSNLSNIYGTQGANQINAITGGANARAAGIIGQANAFNSAVGQGIQLYGMNQQNALLGKYLSR